MRDARSLLGIVILATSLLATSHASTPRQARLSYDWVSPQGLRVAPVCRHLSGGPFLLDDWVSFDCGEVKDAHFQISQPVPDTSFGTNASESRVDLDIVDEGLDQQVMALVSQRLPNGNGEMATATRVCGGAALTITGGRPVHVFLLWGVSSAGASMPTKGVIQAQLS